MPKKSAYPFPRQINPSLVEIGDTIQVYLPKARGLEQWVVGTVHHRSDHGKTRYLYTEEGATIIAWEANDDNSRRVLLLHRPEAVQMPLGFFDTEEPERLAG